LNAWDLFLSFFSERLFVSPPWYTKVLTTLYNNFSQSKRKGYTAWRSSVLSLKLVAILSCDGDKSKYKVYTLLKQHRMKVQLHSTTIQFANNAICMQQKRLHNWIRRKKKKKKSCCVSFSSSFSPSFCTTCFFVY
jgi:hypothetical protein